MTTTLSRAETDTLVAARWTSLRERALADTYPDLSRDPLDILAELNAMPGLPITLDAMRLRATLLCIGRRPIGEGTCPWLDGLGPTKMPTPLRNVHLLPPGPDGFVAQSVGLLREWCHANLILGYDGSPGHTARLNVYRVAMGEPLVRAL